MNDDKFLDEALKEHARHEGNHDQDFLDDLDAKLDEQKVAPEVRREKRTRKSSRRGMWMSAAALAMVGVTAGALYFLDKGQKSTSDLAVLETDEAALERKTLQPLEAPAMAPALRPAISSAPKSKSNDERGIDIEALQRQVRTEGRTIAELEKEIADIGDRFSVEPASRLKNRRFRFEKPEEDQRMTGMIAPRPAKPEIPSGNKYGQLIEQGFLSPLKDPLSTFSIDVDTASYTNVRKLIETGRKIDPNAVRIEEMINYFDYSYAEPGGDHPFAVQTEVAECPWNADHRLVKIALKGKEVGEQRKAANLVFLIDVSGSMNSSDKLPLLVQSFELLLNSLNENDRVSLVVYAGRQAVLLRPTAIDGEGRSSVRAALKNLSAGGSTNGAAGISTAYNLARSGFIEGGVNRVILATDGDFNVGPTSHEKLLELVKNQAEGQISLTILGFGQGNLNDALMEKLTNDGDGNYFYLDSLREAQKVFQDKLTGTIETIAKDVKIQVEFNPGKVAQYRLIGYANRRLKNEDFTNDKVDAGDIGAGHTVTALYEVVPVGAERIVIPGGLKYQKTEEQKPATEVVDSPELLTVKLRYKEPDGDKSTELSQPLTDANANWTEASEDFRFASAVALWGMLLRNSEHAGEGNANLVSELALEARGKDLKGERADFLDLVRKWSLSELR